MNSSFYATGPPEDKKKHVANMVNTYNPVAVQQLLAENQELRKLVIWVNR